MEGASQDKQLVESIVYLASLVAQPKAIDQTLDELRDITARWEAGTPLSPNDKAVLQKLVADLKTYLITSDPLRKFTEEEINQRLAQHFRAETPRKKGPWQFILVVLGCALVSLATFPLPLATSLQARILLAVPVFLMLLTLVNAGFYVTSFRTFKPEIRQVFTYFCVGIIVLGVQFLHFSFISLSGQDELPLYKYGGLPFIALLSFTAIYLGLKKYAALLQVKSVFALWWVVGAAWLGALPFAAGITLATNHDGFFGFSLWSVLAIAILCFCSSFVASAVLHNVGLIYAKSLRVIFIFMISVTLGALAYAAAIVVTGQLSGATLNAALGLCSTIPLILLLYSGYSFKRETRL